MSAVTRLLGGMSAVASAAGGRRRLATVGLSGGRRRLATVAAPEHFLHVGPGGDWWEGGGIYAAKHNPGDYVRSLPLPVGTRLRGDVPAGEVRAMYDAAAVDAAWLEPAWSAGDPTAALAAPGRCQLGDDWTPCALRDRVWVSDDTMVATFDLPDASAPLGLSTCACVLARGGAGDDGEPVVRPYTPVSTNALVGAFQVMVKVYERGTLSRALAALDVGDAVDFKHIAFNVKIQFPFGAKKVGMLAGGTGIAPMLQALHALLGSTDDNTEVTVLYGSRSSRDVLAEATLDDWCAKHARLKVVHVLSDEPAGSASPHARGRIDAGLRVAHVDGYGYRRARSLSEKAFTEDFLGEVAPQLSRRLATALWQALSHDRWSIDEERFVEALAIARCGRDEDKLRLAARRRRRSDDGRRATRAARAGVLHAAGRRRAAAGRARGRAGRGPRRRERERRRGALRPAAARLGAAGRWESAHLRTADLVDAVGLATSRDEIRVAALLRPSREPVRRDDDDESDGLGDSDADFTERLDGRRNLARRRERSEAHELLLASVRDQLCAFVVAALDGWAPGAYEAPPSRWRRRPRRRRRGRRRRRRGPGAYSAAPSSATRPSPDGARDAAAATARRAPTTRLMDASQPGDGDEAPVDVTIELLFDDGGDEPEDGAHVPPLRAYFASGEFRYDINTRSKFGARGALATAFGELLGELDESEEAVTPDTFKRTLGDWNDTFAGFGQQDASEFLQQLLEGLGEDLNRVEDKPYVENPDVAGDAESPFPADPRVQVDVAAECWRNHAELREDHPVTALFGGQTRRELVCDANDVEKSVAVWNSNLQPDFNVRGLRRVLVAGRALFDADSAARGERRSACACGCAARQRCWPVDAVVPVPADAAVGDVLEAAAALPLSSRTLEHAPTLENFDDEPELAAFGGDASNLVAMLPCLGRAGDGTRPTRATCSRALLRLGPRDGSGPPFALRAFASRGSDRERLAAGTLAGSEMLLPDGGRLVPDDGRDCDDAGARGRAVRGGRSYIFTPPLQRPRVAPRARPHVLRAAAAAAHCFEACLAAVGAPETVTKYSAAETRRNGGEYAEAAHTSRVSLWRAPPVLALVLKRFFVTERGRRRKLSDRVAFPVDGLELSTFLDGARDGPGPSYDLVAVVNHFGGLEHGHYTCAARRLDGRGWLEFDDRRGAGDRGRVRRPGGLVLLRAPRRPGGGAAAGLCSRAASLGVAGLDDDPEDDDFAAAFDGA
ncbi:cytochrome-b5 reductase [Aureococcus anophagefferens]|nr:cytochrome-b5 reductase [Aureococcus anophagefferens]